MAGGVVRELKAIFKFDLDKDSLTVINSALGGIKRAVATIGAGAGIASIAHLIEKTAEGASHMLAMAKSTGLSTDALQQWSYVAKQTGSNSTQLVTGIGMFERQMRAFLAGGGSKQFKAGLAEVGIGLAEAKKEFTGVDGVDKALYKISDRLKDLGTNMSSASLGRVLFGARGGAALVADLARGSAGIKEMREHLVSIGGVLDAKTIGNLKNLNTAVQDLKISFGAALGNAVAAVGPQLIDTINEVTSWVGQNSDQIKNFFQGLVEGIQATLKVALGFWSSFADVISSVLESFGVKANKAEIAGYSIGVMLGILATAWTVMWAAALGPVGFVIIGIIAAVAAIREQWDQAMEGLEVIGDALSDFWNDVVAGAHVIGDAFKAAFEEIEKLPIIQALIKLVADIQALRGQKSEDIEQAHKENNEEHPVLGFLSGLSGITGARGDELADRGRVMADQAAGNAASQIHQEVKIEIHGADDPHAVGAAVADHLDGLLRDSHADFGGGAQS